MSSGRCQTLMRVATLMAAGCSAASPSSDPWPAAGPLHASPSPSSLPRVAASASASAKSSASASLPPEAIAQLDLMAIWGSDATHIWITGEKGTILHGDGTSWAQVESGTTAKLRAVTGLDASHVWAAGEHTLLQWDGTRWKVTKDDVDDNLVAALAIDPTHVFALGRGGSIWMWNGASWARQRAKGTELLSLAGEDLAHLYAVGDGALFLQFDGKSSWKKRPSPPSYFPATQADGSYSDEEGHVFFTRAYVKNGHMFLSNSYGYVIEGEVDGSWIVSEPGNPSDNWGIYGFWGTDPGRMWMVADEFIAWRSQRGPWNRCITQLMYGVWGTDEHNVWAVGASGLIVKLDDHVLVNQPACNLPERGKWTFRR